MRKVLVTGGAGFIGSHLVDELLATGHKVLVLDALVEQVHGVGGGWPSWTPGGAETIKGDVRSRSVWDRALEDVEVVFHLAAEVGVGQSMYEVSRYMEANTMGTAHLLELLISKKHRVEKLVVASSMSIYGEGAYQTSSGIHVFPPLRSTDQLAMHRWECSEHGNGQPLKPVPTPEDKPLRPASIYAISKRDQEEMSLSIGRAYGIPTIALRFFNVYGPRQALSNPYTGVVAIFASRLLNGKSPIVFEDGHQTRDFVHVKDVVRALHLAMEHSEADYEAINVGTGRAMTILGIADLLISKLGANNQAQVVSQYRAGDIRHCVADINKAKNLLAYEPRVHLEDGIDELIEWLQHQTAYDRLAAATQELSERGLTF